VVTLKAEMSLLRSEPNTQFQGRIGGYPHYLGKAGKRKVRLGMVGTASGLHEWVLTMSDMAMAESEILVELGVLMVPASGLQNPLMPAPFFKRCLWIPKI
jgi:hypothetical protein